MDRSTTYLSKSKICTDESKNEGHDIEFDIVSKNFIYTLPSQGQYYLVIDNSGLLNNGADAKRDVNVQVTVKLIR